MTRLAIASPAIPASATSAGLRSAAGGRRGRGSRRRTAGCRSRADGSSPAPASRSRRWRTQRQHERERREDRRQDHEQFEGQRAPRACADAARTSARFVDVGSARDRGIRHHRRQRTLRPVIAVTSRAQPADDRELARLLRAEQLLLDHRCRCIVIGTHRSGGVSFMPRELLARDRPTIVERLPVQMQLAGRAPYGSRSKSLCPCPVAQAPPPARRLAPTRRSPRARGRADHAGAQRLEVVARDERGSEACRPPEETCRLRSAMTPSTERRHPGQALGSRATRKSPAPPRPADRQASS